MLVVRRASPHAIGAAAATNVNTTITATVLAISTRNATLTASPLAAGLDDLLQAVVQRRPVGHLELAHQA